MRAFIDTSALLKRYLDEPGGKEFDDFLRDVTEVVVAPTYLIEAHAAVERRYREKEFSRDQVHWLKESIGEDAGSYEIVSFSQDLCDAAIGLVGVHPLTALDSMQLAAAMMARADIFVTSDKQLYKYAKYELKKVKLI